MEGKPKICPLMTIAVNDNISAVTEDGWIMCQQEKCEWWTGIYTMEGKHSCGMEYGCAIRKLAEKGPDGSVQA